MYFIQMFGYKIQTTPLYHWLQLYSIILLDVNFDNLLLNYIFFLIFSMFEIYRKSNINNYIIYKIFNIQIFVI